MLSACSCRLSLAGGITIEMEYGGGGINGMGLGVITDVERMGRL